VLALQSGDDTLELRDIARYMHVDIQGAQKWRSKSLPYIRAGVRVPCTPMMLPEPDDVVGNKPIWWERTIVRWGMWTGRITPDGQVTAFKPGRGSRPRPSRGGAGAPVAVVREQ
jgi:hypothetical protein